jgi:AP-3 complex subunit beta
LFSPHYARFIVQANDSTQVKVIKTCLLQNFVTIDNYQALLCEFIVCLPFHPLILQLANSFLHLVGSQDYTDDVDEALVAGTIQRVSHIAHTFPEATAQCLNVLMACIKNPHGRSIFPSSA